MGAGAGGDDGQGPEGDGEHADGVEEVVGEHREEGDAAREEGEGTVGAPRRGGEGFDEQR